MDKIVNVLLLIIIFVFDPLAIALVIAANFAFTQLKNKEDNTPNPEYNEWDVTLEDGLEDLDKESPITPYSSQLSFSFPPHSSSPISPSTPTQPPQPQPSVDGEEVIKEKTKNQASLEPSNLSAWRRNKMAKERKRGSDDTSKRYF